MFDRKQWRKDNPDKEKSYRTKYVEKNKHKVLLMQRKYRELNRDKINKRAKNWLDKNPEKRKLYILRRKEYRETHPWIKTWESVNSRTSGYDKNRLWYIENGIKNTLKWKDLQYIWFRDKAYNMKRPNLHRKNNKGNYTKRNCVYLEEKEHFEVHGK